MIADFCVKDCLNVIRQIDPMFLPFPVDITYIGP